MSALDDKKEIQNYSDLEEQKRPIDETNLNKGKWRESQITNREDVNEEDYTAGNQVLLEKPLDFKRKIEVLLTSGDAVAILPSLVEAEQRLADVRVNSAAHKTRSGSTSLQKEPTRDDDQEVQKGPIPDDDHELGDAARSLPIGKLEISPQLGKTKSNRNSVIPKAPMYDESCIWC